MHHESSTTPEQLALSHLPALTQAINAAFQPKTASWRNSPAVLSEQARPYLPMNSLSPELPSNFKEPFRKPCGSNPPCACLSLAGLLRVRHQAQSLNRLLPGACHLGVLKTLFLPVVRTLGFGLWLTSHQILDQRALTFRTCPATYRLEFLDFTRGAPAEVQLLTKEFRAWGRLAKHLHTLPLLTSTFSGGCQQGKDSDCMLCE